MVSSLVIVTDLAKPKVALTSSGELEHWSRDDPVYSHTNLPPVKTAISWSVAFLLSPKEGAFTAHTFKLFFKRFNINPANNSP